MRQAALALAAMLFAVTMNAAAHACGYSCDGAPLTPAPITAPADVQGCDGRSCY